MVVYSKMVLLVASLDRVWKAEELPPVEQPWSHSDVSAKINMLQKIAVNLRKKRVESGALRIDQPKVCFILNKQSWLPEVWKLFTLLLILTCSVGSGLSLSH